VIPVLVIEDVQQAVPLARALVEGGLPVLEVTLRTQAALKAIETISDQVEGAIVGVGTITRPDEMTQALNAGARFAVSPGLTVALAEKAQASGIPFLPGVMTPSEIIEAKTAGYTAMKFFPAHQAGGIAMLKALAGPFPEVNFCPTGGITEETFRDYLALPNVRCVGGSWVVPKTALESCDWSTITRLALQASRR
jgi:2-dehydro-3-deoxyphosphogluconate aldolase/(4S)-4-hydroxy-2-oxoglutarate aldolase